MTSIIVPGVETRANSYTTSYQVGSQITTLSDGGFVITWQSNGQDGDGDGIYSQTYDAAGQPVGAEVQVNSVTAGYQGRPAVTALSDGGYLIAWTSDGQDGSGSGIYAQRYDAWGIKVGSETLINATTAESQSSPTVTGLSDGGYVVTWQSFGQDGDLYGIYAQRYDETGGEVGGEVPINTTTAGYQEAPHITELTGGGYVITWQSHGQDGSDYGVYSRLFDADGAPVGDEIPVNTYTTSAQQRPAVAALSDGGYVITWQSYGQDGSSNGVYSQGFDATGHKSGNETRVNAYTTDFQYQPDVVGLSDGGYVVVWSSGGQDGSNGGIYAQRFDGTGAAIGPENLVTTMTLPDQYEPSVSALADGGYVVSWTSYGQDGDGYGIYYKTFSAAGDDLSGSQRLYGTAGNETLDGGAGPDQMYGGGGNDTYIVDNIGDRAFENANGVDTGGVDIVLASATFTLGSFVENLTLTGTAAINGTGNSLANVLHGNTAANILNGGSGADKMYGGAGDDTYVVDNAGDLVAEYYGTNNMS